MAVTGTRVIEAARYGFEGRGRGADGRFEALRAGTARLFVFPES